MKAPLPENETARIQLLHQLEILDTPHEKNFDDIARIAMTVCEVPVAVVSLVDINRQWFKSCLGLDASETPREVAFCAHAILQPNQIMIVEDSLLDERFSDNSLVTGAPFIRFYAGVPLVMMSGLALGTLCVIDFVPRTLDARQQELLVLLAHQTVQLLQQKQQQLALEQERENLDAVIRGTNIGTWRWNVQTGETIFNERWADIIGYRLEELMPLSIQHSLVSAHPDDLPEVNRLLESHFSGQLDYYDCKYRMRHKQGHWVWVHDRGCVTSWTDDRKPEWMSGTHADITQSEEAHQLIEQNEKKLSALYQLSPVAIALNRMSDGAFLEANPEFYRMIGYLPEEFTGRTYWDITPSDYEKQELEQLESLHISGRYGPYEKHYVHKEGHWISVLLNGVLVESIEGEQQIWSIIQDITERKRIEQMKNDFVSAVSHELRTPLTSISGSLSLALNGLLGPISSKAQEMLGVAQKNAQRLGLLINDLLDMEKLAVGKMDFDFQPQLLVPIIEQSIEANKVYASHFGVSYSLSVSTGAAMVNVDAQRLQQIMANFLSNAAKFSPQDGVVDVRVEAQSGRARISVIDHGQGISEEFRARIFQKFSQADASASRRRGGTGLGLAISKELAERMQGEIGFTSVPGKGTTFFVSFPLVQLPPVGDNISMERI